VVPRSHTRLRPARAVKTPGLRHVKDLQCFGGAATRWFALGGVAAQAVSPDADESVP
jgi:hypothetical protein